MPAARDGVGNAQQRTRDRPGSGYRRDRLTWAAFGALAGFAFLNAILDRSCRAVEHISYLAGSLHQAAFAVGGRAR